MNRPDISNTMLKLRRNAGYTQALVSQKLNIQRQTYCNYENASRTPPLEIIVALAELYHVSLDYLVCGENAPAGRFGSAGDTAAGDAGQKLLDAFTSLPESDRREILAYIQFKKQYQS